MDDGTEPGTGASSGLKADTEKTPERRLFQFCRTASRSLYGFQVLGNTEDKRQNSGFFPQKPTGHFENFSGMFRMFDDIGRMYVFIPDGVWRITNNAAVLQFF